MLRRTAGAASIALCLAVAVSIFMTACGGGGSEGLPKRTLPENATPEKIMLEGLNATDEASSLHYVFDYSFMIPPTGQQAYTSEVALQGEGDFNAKSGDAQAHMVWPSFDIEFDYKLYQGTQYYRTEEGGTWYQLPEGYSMSIPSISEITRNTAEYMDNFQAINRLPDETLDGKDCYHIAMVPNFDAIMENQQFMDMIKGDREQLDEEFLEKLDEMKKELQEANVNYEYWIDKQYLVLRRTLYNIEMVESGDDQSASYTVKMVMQISFPLYNQKVEVTPPESSTMYEGAS